MLSLFKRNPSTESAERAPAAHGKSAADIDHDASMRSIDSSAHSEAPTRRESSATARRASSTSLVAPGSPESATSEAISETFGSLDDLPHLRPIEQDGLSMHELAEAMIKDAKDQEYIVPIVSRMLTITVERNDRLGRRSNLESFEGQRAPVTISQYINRIVKYGGCSSCVFVVGLMYLNRLKRLDPSVRITSHNFQRLFLVAVMEASKFLDDHYYSNKHWAQIGGIPTKELNEIEINLLNKLDFKLHIQREEYDWYVEKLYNRAQRESHSGPLSAPQQPAMAHSPPKPTSVSPPTSMSKSLWSMFFDKRGSSKDLHRSTSGSSQLSEEALSAMNTPRNITVAQPMSGSSLAGPASGPGTASFSMPMSYSIAPSSHNQCPVFLRDPAAPAAPQGGSMQRQRVQQQQQAPPQKQMMPPPQQQYQAQQQQFHAPPQQQQQALHCRAPQQMYAPNYVQATQQQQQPMHCFQAPAPVPGPQQVVFFQG